MTLYRIQAWPIGEPVAVPWSRGALSPQTALLEMACGRVFHGEGDGTLPSSVPSKAQS